VSRLIIGVVGPAGSGKSAVAKHLVTKYGFFRMRFAENLKAMLKVGLGLSDEQIDGDLKMVPLPEFGGCTPRHIMQTLGTDWGRRLIHSDVWVSAWRKKLPGTGLVVVDDVRFPNEAAAIKSEGGFLWRIDRPGIEAMAHDHPSERFQAQIATDITLVNETNLFDLMLKVDAKMAGRLA
jgi:hypothetical protein